MAKNKKLLIGVLAVAVVLGTGWLTWNSQTPELNCSKITSMQSIEKCLGERIEAVGILECEKPGIPSKAGVHYLKFEDGTELRFLEEYPSCESYDGQKVRAIGEFYQCRGFDQCGGNGLRSIESVNLISGIPKQGVTITTDKTEYEQGETVKFTLFNNSSKSIWYVSGTWACNTKYYEIYIFSNNAWNKILTYAPICSAVEGAGAPIYKELLPNDSLIFDWNQELWDYNTDTYNAKVGKYKISMKYKELKEAEETRERYSNEFTIIEKTAEEPTDFYTCANYSDCISVKADCCGCTAGGKAISINKFHQDEWLNNLGCSGVICPAVMSNDPSCINKKPKCEIDKCVLQ